MAPKVFGLTGRLCQPSPRAWGRMAWGRMAWVRMAWVRWVRVAWGHASTRRDTPGNPDGPWNPSAQATITPPITDAPTPAPYHALWNRFPTGGPDHPASPSLL